MTGWRLPRLSVDRPCVGFLGYGNAQAHTEQGNMLIRDIIARMRHDGCGGRAWQGGAAHRHRGRQQPAGAPDRAAWRRPMDDNQ